MKMRVLFNLFFLFFYFICFSQQNFDFNILNKNYSLPDNWFMESGDSAYEVMLDSTTIYGGMPSVTIFSYEKSNSYGTINSKISNGYVGDTLSLSAYIKTEQIEKGDAKIMISLLNKRKTIMTSMLQSYEITGTTDWKKYTVKIPFVDADSIFIAGGLSGKGQVWFSNFELRVDGENITELEFIKRSLPKAELDNEFNDCSKFTIKDINELTVTRLSELCVVWGNLKYNNKLVSEGEYNWDFELFRILPIINDIDFSQKLSKWRESFGISSNQIAENHYYVDFTPNVGNATFVNENNYKGIDFNDQGYRLLSLFRYWNAIEYFFPYKHLITKNWSDVLEEYIVKLLDAKGELEFKIGLMELTKEIQDGHSFFNAKGDTSMNLFLGLRRAPLKVQFIEDRLFVSEFLSEAKSEFAIGDEILFIDGRDVCKVLKERENFYPFSNHAGKLSNMSSFMLRTNKEVLDIDVVDKDGFFLRKSIETNNIKELNYYNNVSESHKEFSKDLGYIHLGALKENDLELIMSNFKFKKGIALDFRSYPSISVGELMKYFVPNDIDFVKHKTPDRFDLGNFKMSESTKTIGSVDNYYEGKVVVLVDETTMSAAEYYTMALQVSPNVQVFGSQTAGTDGNISMLKLPGDIEVTFSGIGIYYPDESETQKVGVRIDKYVIPKLKEFIEGRDAILEEALEFLSK